MSNDTANEGDIGSDYLEAVSFNFSVLSQLQTQLKTSPAFFSFSFSFQPEEVS